MCPLKIDVFFVCSSETCDSFYPGKINKWKNSHCSCREAYFLLRCNTCHQALDQVCLLYYGTYINCIGVTIKSVTTSFYIQPNFPHWNMKQGINLHTSVSPATCYNKSVWGSCDLSLSWTRRWSCMQSRVTECCSRSFKPKKWSFIWQKLKCQNFFCDSGIKSLSRVLDVLLMLLLLMSNSITINCKIHFINAEQ